MLGFNGWAQNWPSVQLLERVGFFFFLMNMRIILFRSSSGCANIFSIITWLHTRHIKKCLHRLGFVTACEQLSMKFSTDGKTFALYCSTRTMFYLIGRGCLFLTQSKVDCLHAFVMVYLGMLGSESSFLFVFSSVLRAMRAACTVLTHPVLLVLA